MADEEYQEPAGDALKFSFKGEVYVPPEGNALRFNFTLSEGGEEPGTTTYVFPESFVGGFGTASLRAGQSFLRAVSFSSVVVGGVGYVGLYSRYLKHTGAAMGAMGVGAVYNLNRVLRPGTITPPQLGANIIRLKNQPVFTVGLPPGLVSTTTRLVLRTQYVLPGGINASRYGVSHWIRDRAFYPKVTGFMPMVVNHPIVTHEIQRLTLLGWRSSVVARPAFRLEKHSIYVPFIFATDFGMAWAADGVRTLSVHTPPNTEHVAGRGTRVERSIRAVYPEGWNKTGYSTQAAVYDARKFVYPFSAPAPDFVGPGTIFNKIQELRTGVWGDGKPDTAEYGLVQVTLGDRTVYAFSVNQWRVGVGVDVHRFAGDIFDVNVPGQEIFGRALAAPRVRMLPVSGDITGWVGAYTSIHNAAFQVLPKGAANVANVSEPSLRNLNRTYKVPSISQRGYESVVGALWVSYGVRTLGAFGVKVSTFVPEEHWISWQTRFVSPLGLIPPSIEGKREVEVHSRLMQIKPWYAQRDDAIGTFYVVNRNRTVKPYGYDFSEYGRAHVEWLQRPLLYVSVGPALAIPRPVIKDRRLFIELRNFSIRSAFVSKDLSVRNLLADPPWTRTVYPGGGESRAYVSGPKVTTRTTTLYVPSLNYRVSYGFPTLRRNTIAVYGGISEYNWGAVTATGPKWIEARGIARTLGELPQPRMSPHTIFAPHGTEAPAKYAPNPPSNAHEVDALFGVGATSVTNKNSIHWIPLPWVSLKNRTIRGVGTNMALYGRPKFPTEDNPIVGPYTRVVKPDGWRAHRTGWVTVVPFDIKVQLLSGIQPANAFGVFQIKLAYIPINPPRASGFVTTRYGQPYVELFNRMLLAKGALVNAYGGPTIWFRIRKFNFTGWQNVQRYGSPRIFNRVQHIYAHGSMFFNPVGAFEALETTVRNRYNGQVLSAKGRVQSLFGVADVDRYTKYVVPRGMFPTPPLRPRLKTRAEIEVFGFESQVFGRVRKYEEGVVYPHEFGAGAVGVVVVSTSRQVQGFVSSMVNYPTVAAHIGPQGIESEGVGAAVLKNEICCGGCG